MRRNIFILIFLIAAITLGGCYLPPPQPATVQVRVAAPAPAAVVEYPPEEYIPEGDPTPPPPLPAAEPELVVVPSGEEQVYMVPNTVGIYFYGGSWYRYHHGVWFSAPAYNEPWIVVQPAIVPSFVVGIPPAYALSLPPSYHRIHYREFHSNWRTWDRDRHWHREQWFRNERRAEIRYARERQANEHMERERRERAYRVKADPIGYQRRLADPGRYNRPNQPNIPNPPKVMPPPPKIKPPPPKVTPPPPRVTPPTPKIKPPPPRVKPPPPKIKPPPPKVIPQQKDKSKEIKPNIQQ